jgi:hypothetical protein
VTAGEYEAQALVRELVRLHIVGGAAATERLECLQRRAFLGQRALAANPVDRLVTGDLRDPRPGVARNPVPRPTFQRDGERLLYRLLGEVEVAHRPDERRDRPTRLVPEQAVDDCGWIGGAGHRRTGGGGGPYDAAFARSSGWT